MITELTKEQEQLLKQVCDEWIAKLNDSPPLNKERATKGVKWLYRLAKLDEPEVVFADGPLVAVRASVGASVRDSVGASVRDSVWDSVWASVRDSVWDSVWASVWASVRDSVGASVWASVRDSVFPVYGDIDDFHWLAWSDFFRRIGVTLTDDFESFRQLVGDCGIFSMIQGKDKCVVYGMPEFIKREPDGVRMHCVDGPCIRWKDGFEMYQLHGVTFTKEDHAKAVSASAKGALAWGNIEQRRAIFRVLGIEKVFSELDTKLLDESQGYQLYAVNGYARETAYALRYLCPSTGREYVSFVRPEVGEKRDAIAAIASKWGLSREMWGRIAAHS